MRISADRDRCIGAGMCVLTAADLFDQDEEEGLVLVRDGAPGADREKDVLRAARLCPSGALSVTRDA
ncbi:ferredoxin [Nocardiopsis sp. RSe5-2]|uniref:Ferredoxin n=1 Tax=Nocardiopsis endophytica TaxID=3018445 RepID=A0ABT4U607_9ACTN|nr:ferredoxin [Nocardiopsis endophytica]MDA2812166.1 ferredoxin [Nocardiopsis endophytica]